MHRTEYPRLCLSSCNNVILVAVRYQAAHSIPPSDVQIITSEVNLDHLMMFSEVWSQLFDGRQETLRYVLKGFGVTYLTDVRIRNGIRTPAVS